MGKIQNFENMRFGKLTVIKRDISRNKGTYWFCQCDCGSPVKSIRGDSLKSGRIVSCGCYNIESFIKRHTTHGKSKHPLHSVWMDMKDRCNVDSHKSYHNYGGRGIEVCLEWTNSFESFYEWAISNGYNKGLEIDRINNDGNYEPNNCRFVTRQENTAVGRRRKSNRNTSGYNGVKYKPINGKWTAFITVNRKYIHIGTYENKEDALQARILEEIKIFGRQLTNLDDKSEINMK